MSQNTSESHSGEAAPVDTGGAEAASEAARESVPRATAAPPATSDRGVGVAAAAAGTALLAIAWYAIDRSVAAVLHPSIDPSLVIAGERIEYFWRVTICAWGSPVLFAALFVAARGRERRALELARVAVAPVVLLAAALAVVFP